MVSGVKDIFDYYKCKVLPCFLLWTNGKVTGKSILDFDERLIFCLLFREFQTVSP